MSVPWLASGSSASGTTGTGARAFGNRIAPLQLAIGKADAFTGYVDLVHRTAWTLQGGKEVEAWARRLGMTTPIIPDQALALGASCTRIDELTRAFQAAEDQPDVPIWGGSNLAAGSDSELGSSLDWTRLRDIADAIVGEAFRNSSAGS